MPIFREEVTQNYARSRRLKRASNQSAREVRGRVVRSFGQTNYPVVHTMFSAIDACNFGRLSEAIDIFAAHYPNRKIFVLDWGCGKGNAVRQLAEENPRTEVFGFSKDAYPEQLTPSKGTILATSSNAFYRYLRLKKIKFDVVYSNLGLAYVEPATEIIKVSQFVQVGGVIFPGFYGVKENNEYGHDKDFFPRLKSAGLEPTFLHGQLISLTRTK